MRNGTDQKGRQNPTLDPASLKLHDFEIEDWMLFAYNFAKHVNFFTVTDDQNSAGDWQALFNHFEFATSNIPKRTDREYVTLKKNITNLLSNTKDTSDLTPHLTLFVCFLKLLNLSKKRFNQISQRHLDFFYAEILQIEKLPPTPDLVHVIFELAKRSAEERIEVDTLLDGGKDPDGKKLIYKTTEELVANKASVVQLKSLYNDIKLDKGEIKSSQVANSLDGNGEELPEEANYWWPFGYTSQEENYPELQDAKLGFALSSPLFNLQEGERNLNITIAFSEILDFGSDTFNATDLNDNIDIYYSGEKEWHGTFNLNESLSFKIDGNDVSKSSAVAGKELRLVFQIPKDFPAVYNYDQEILGERFSSTNPVIRFLIKTENKKGHLLYRNLVNKVVENITVSVDVKGIKSVVLDSDTGVLNSDKPFYPFTTQPVEGSNFKIDYPEMFSKKLSGFDLNIIWKNTPSSFKNHYKAYKEDYLNETSKTIFYEGMFNIENSLALTANQPDEVTEESINNTIDSQKAVLNEDGDLIVKSDDHFKVDLQVLNKEDWQAEQDDIILFKKTDSEENLYETEISVTAASYEIDKSGPIKLSLTESFLHALFPRIYTLALISENPLTLIPNEPYTPFAESISLGYAAEESTDFTKQNFEDYEGNRIRLFHEDAFGQYEEHSYLKNKLKTENILHKNTTTNSWLVPDHCHGGELYIGLKDAEVSQQVALLIQVLEGSENPDADSFVGRQKVEWAVLCQNQWKDLEKDMLANSIDNFLKSGTVKFSIPKVATKTNTRFPKDFIWIRAKMHKDYDAICKVIAIKAQAVLAKFEDDDNDLSHLRNGLPAETISKLINRIPQIKSVTQPFNSFGGKMLESDTAYYRRVSERLRHKNRVITQWDYENHILQEFQEIYRVKCLNHTSESSFLSPGDVLVVVIPDIVNKNVFDIYEPRVSTATLNKIQNHINSLNTMHVEAKVINPKYQKVVVKLNVKFYQQFDENFYKIQLNEDLTKFLSPWAFDNTQEIAFGIELHRSILMDYIEKLFYVDYLEELEIANQPSDLEEPEDPTDPEYLNQLEFVKSLAPESPKHILVSAKQHIIFTTIKTCTAISIEEKEICQY